MPPVAKPGGYLASPETPQAPYMPTLPPEEAASDPSAMVDHLVKKYKMSPDEASKMAVSLNTGSYPEAVAMRAEVAKASPPPKGTPGRTTTPWKDPEGAKDYGASQSRIARVKSGGYLNASDAPSVKDSKVSVDGHSAISQPAPVSDQFGVQGSPAWIAARNQWVDEARQGSPAWVDRRNREIDASVARNMPQPTPYSAIGALMAPPTSDEGQAELLRKQLGYLSSVKKAP